MKVNFKHYDHFKRRQIGPDESELKEMLQTVGVKDLDELMHQTIPERIWLKKALNIPAGIQEDQYLQMIKKLAEKNKLFKTYIGLGYYDCITPAVILRNIFENPGWYTQYTPYQAEISQGRLEALLNFQTMVSDLTAMEVANASLLDEATAAAEAMTMLYRLRSRNKVSINAHIFLVSESCFPQTIDVLKTRAEPMNIELQIKNYSEFKFNEQVFGAIVQYPDADGSIQNYTQFIQKAHDHEALVAVVADLLSLTLLTPPGEMDADVVVGSSQRFGVPLCYGGPHAAYFATREAYQRQIPGRIIGVSIDRHGHIAYRMALQTREQHIRRDKATSNICTAQALLAIMAGMYAVYHGPEGLKAIAGRIHALARILDNTLNKLGIKQLNQNYFDTIKLELKKEELFHIKKTAELAEINFRYIDETHIGISLDEKTGTNDIDKITTVFSKSLTKKNIQIDWKKFSEGIEFNYSAELVRKSDFLTHPVFHRYHSETKMMRYIKLLENRDLSLTSSMIPLGSCTMKLNPASAMLPISLPEISNLHPFVPIEQAQGYMEIIRDLEKILCEITGFAAASLQPNSGAQGEYTGLSVIRAYQKGQGEGHRDVTLIPSSAHGTNPASAVMAGTKVVVVNCEENGDIDLNDLSRKATEYKDNLCSLMVTYPSTHGVFEERIKEICDIIHQNGGQVYMDGANMNAQVGITCPACIGADVCHLNLHKTFGIPHGGGGPGVGPICVASHLAPFLPGHIIIKTGGEKAISAVSATPWGSPSICLISYGVIKMLGLEGLTDVTHYAILNANYIKARLEKYFPVLYKGKNGHVGHELIFDLRPFKKEASIEVDDVAKRLMDFGFHAPTTSFPVIGTIMVEPTESESKEELDRFCDAMLVIYEEIQEIIAGKVDRQNNLLKNAPHTAAEIVAADWIHPYSREKAAFPLLNMKENKFWPPVARIDNTYGDRNLFCSCPPLDEYNKEE